MSRNWGLSDERLRCERSPLAPVNLLSQSMLVLLWVCKSSIEIRPDRQVKEFSRGLRAFSSSGKIWNPTPPEGKQGRKTGGRGREDRKMLTDRQIKPKQEVVRQIKSCGSHLRAAKTWFLGIFVSWKVWKWSETSGTVKIGSHTPWVNGHYVALFDKRIS